MGASYKALKSVRTVMSKSQISEDAHRDCLCAFIGVPVRAAADQSIPDIKTGRRTESVIYFI